MEEEEVLWKCGLLRSNLVSTVVRGEPTKVLRGQGGRTRSVLCWFLFLRLSSHFSLTIFQVQDMEIFRNLEQVRLDLRYLKGSNNMAKFSAVDIWSCQSDQIWPSRAEGKVPQRNQNTSIYCNCWFPTYFIFAPTLSPVACDPIRGTIRSPPPHKWPMHMAAPGYLERDINSVQEIADILLFVRFASILVKIDKLTFGYYVSDGNLSGCH